MASHVSDPWGDPEVATVYETDGPIDEGERAVLAHIAPRLPGSRFLDIGIGSGRTCHLIAGEVGSYVGIDYSEGMVTAAKARFPELDLRQGDGSDLADFADASVDVLLFSYNGIDCLGRKERLRAFSEFARVVVPGGTVAFSTFSIDGLSYGETPDRRNRRGIVATTVRFVRDRFVSREEKDEQRRAYAATAVGADSGDGWATAPVSEHGWRFLVHFTRLGVLEDDLASVGIELEAAWTPEGLPIDLATGRAHTDYFHVVATRR